MNSSYKITLFVTIVLCGLILGYYMTQDDQNQTPTLDDQTAIVDGTSNADGRPTLRGVDANSSSSATNTRTNDRTTASGSQVIPPPTANTGRAPSASSSSTGSLLDSVNSRTQGSAAPIAPPPAAAIPPASGNTNTSPVTSDPRSVTQNNASPASNARNNATNNSVRPIDRNPTGIPDTGRSALRNNTPTTGRTYTIKPGDTLSSIAEKTLGSEAKWHAIGEANPYLDPRKLKVGQVIQIPDPQAPSDSSPTSSSSSSAASGPLEYLVRDGDSLSRIARMHYSDPTLWEVIYRANKAVIGKDPADIRPGMKLFIPPEPRSAH